MKKYLVELLLSHLSDEILNKLQKKAPQKQGRTVILYNQNKNARKNCIELLTNINNIDYTIDFLETGRVHITVKENYLLGKNLVSLTELEQMILKRGGAQLGYLIFVIEQYNLGGLSSIFDDNPEIVLKFTTFLATSELQDYIIKNENTDSVATEHKVSDEFEIKLNKLKKKIEQNKRREERDRKHYKDILSQLHEQNYLYDKQTEELNEIKKKLLDKEFIISEKELKLNKVSKLFENALKKNNELEKEINELMQTVALLKQDQKSLLVIGNLPNNSILDNLNYHIIVLPDTIKFVETINKNEFVKVYIQSEYVSISEYFELKHEFTGLSFEYTSRKNMIKG